MAKRTKPQSEYMRRKLQRKAPPKPKRRSKQSRKQRDAAQIAMLRQIIREATKTGATEAIEHCANFWSVSDGYKKYINHQIEAQADALLAAVRTVLRQERELRRKL